MINLQEYVVVRQGTEYVPLDIALKAVKEAYEVNNSLDKAEKSINDAMSEINNIFKDLD